ncbi:MULTISPECIES: HAMP domain-containing sensor histidine kinase [Streptomyces]|uniref:Signal transduction histidine-protein kinase/phosphatase MprB n=1 Tax=Streptomyces lycii TaxID=2654337 RepID=A0ABQ7FDD0_9ACTN|nr:MULTISPECIES: HAMP domain-containing sensor histidine kinase [Streptomyces]KAF4407071.1 HAMP domain-containing histidine kinase [Streptomyces lycii]PGH50257.1 two-component sensor histidine kinase [Streptomyces sp. Ru87]
MRWALVKVCLAVTAMVVVAFAVPLGLVVKEMARDRAFSDAERQAATVGPALAITTDRTKLERAVASTEAGAAGRIAVHVPPGAGDGGDGRGGGGDGAGDGGARGEDAGDGAGRGAVEIGERHSTDDALAEAGRLGRGSISAVPGGWALLQPTAVGSGKTAVVEVFVPEKDVTNGVTTAWLVLAGVGLALIVGSVAVADRLGTRMVRPAGRLAAAAQDLGDGRLATRVPEDGPAELRSAAAAFNSMADQVVRLLDNERELAADLSHRLRTPLTVLRLNAASLGDGPAADQTRAAVAQLEGEVDQIIRTAREQRPQTRGQGGAAGGCDASEVIRERMAFWSALAEDEDRTVRLAGVERTVRVPVARPELAAALDAMLGNVFRHTAEGTAFAVDVHHAEDAVIVLVSDAGPGIADPEAALRRGHGDGGRGSTGLGLDIVRRVAESTGGDVRIGRSVLGGTEVRMWLALGGRRPDGGRRVDRLMRRGRGRKGPGVPA